MPKKKKLVPNSGKSIAEILKDNEATNSDGRISQAFTKNYDYFEDINCIYSEEYPEGKMLELLHIVLYCRFQRFQSNGKKCYESQGRLGQIFRSDPGTIGDKVKELVKMGLVTTELNPDPKYDTLLYTALPLTDAHVIPPDQRPATPVIVTAVISDQPAQIQAPESEKAAEEKPDDVPDWFYSENEVKPKPTPAPTMTKVIEEAVIVAQSVPKSVATTESAQPVIDEDMALEIVCKRLSQPESLRQSQRDDTFTAYAHRVLRTDGKRLSSRFDKRLEKRFEQLYPLLYSRFEISF